MGKRKGHGKKWQTAYNGPLHQEQYVPELLKMFNNGAFKPGQVSIVNVVHDEDDDGNVIDIVVHEIPPKE